MVDDSPVLTGEDEVAMPVEEAGLRALLDDFEPAPGPEPVLDPEPEPKPEPEPVLEPEPELDPDPEPEPEPVLEPEPALDPEPEPGAEPVLELELDVEVAWAAVTGHTVVDTIIVSVVT